MAQVEQSLASPSSFSSEAAVVSSGTSQDAVPLLAYGPGGSRVTAITYVSGTKTIGGKTLPNFGNGGNLALVKLAADGTASWVKGFKAGNANHIEPEALTVDSAGNIYLSGQTAQPISLGGPTLQPGRFLAKFSSTGAHLLSRNTRPDPGMLFAIRDFEVSPNGDILAVASLVRESDGNSKPMVIRYAANTLEARWTKIFTPNSGVLAGGFIAVDEFNRPYFTGVFTGSVTFGSTTLVSTHPGTRVPFSTQLGPLKEAVVLLPDDSWLNDPGGSPAPFFLNVYDRVSGTLLDRRTLQDGELSWDVGQLAIDKPTGNVSVGAVANGQVSLVSSSQSFPVNGDAFFLEYRR